MAGSCGFVYREHRGVNAGAVAEEPSAARAGAFNELRHLDGSHGATNTRDLAAVLADAIRAFLRHEPGAVDEHFADVRHGPEHEHGVAAQAVICGAADQVDRAAVFIEWQWGTSCRWVEHVTTRIGSTRCRFVVFAAFPSAMVGGLQTALDLR
jgi:hypothetical protein